MFAQCATPSPDGCVAPGGCRVDRVFPLTDRLAADARIARRAGSRSTPSAARALETDNGDRHGKRRHGCVRAVARASSQQMVSTGDRHHLHGAGRESSIRLDPVRRADGRETPLGTSGDPDRVHHFHRHENLARARSVCAALGWIIDANATSLVHLYIAAVIGDIGAGCVYGTCVGTALKWFPDKRGFAAVTVIPISNMIQKSGYEHAFIHVLRDPARRVHLRARADARAPEAARAYRAGEAHRLDEDRLHAGADGARAAPRRSSGCSI